MRDITVTKDYGDFGKVKGMPKKSHPGFAAVQAKIAKRQGISQERAGAILAAGARKASTKAVKANPRLKRISGVKKGK